MHARPLMRSGSSSWALRSPAFSPLSVSETSNLSDAPASWHTFPREFSPPSRFRVTPPEDLVLPRPRARLAASSSLSSEEACSSSDDGSLPPDSFSGPSWVSSLPAAPLAPSDPACVVNSGYYANETPQQGFAMPSSIADRARAVSEMADTCPKTRAPEVRESEVGFVQRPRCYSSMGLPLFADQGPHSFSRDVREAPIEPIKKTRSNTTIGFGLSDERGPWSFTSTGFALEDNQGPRGYTCIGLGSTADAENSLPIEDGGKQGHLFSPIFSSKWDLLERKSERSIHRPVPNRARQQTGRFHNYRKKQASLPSVVAGADAVAVSSATNALRKRGEPNGKEKEKPRLLSGFTFLGKEGTNGAVSRVFRRLRRTSVGVD